MRRNTCINTVLLLSLAAAITVSGYKLWNIDSQYKNEAAIRGAMAQYKPPLELTFAPNGNSNTKNSPAAPNQPENASANAACLSVLKARQEVNSDIVGWLTIPDTAIDYPIVQGRDNGYYLNRDINGHIAPAGSIFLDSACRPDFTQRYAIIYGHSMKNGSMFGSLLHYTGREYFKSHAAGALCLTEQTYELQIFACMVVDADDPVIYGAVSSDKQQDEFLAYVRANARQYGGVSPEHTDRILALSTCAYDFSGARLVVLARILNT